MVGRMNCWLLIRAMDPENRSVIKNVLCPTSDSASKHEFVSLCRLYILS